MKLATALSERADLQSRINELSGRLNNNAKVQEGEKPAEDPQVLLAELDSCTQRLQYLITAINLTNSIAVCEGETVTALLAKRDVLKLKITTLRSFLNNASSKVDRYSKSEIKVYSTVDVAAMQKQTDDLAAQLRKTEEMIQQSNWTVDLME